jgi:hypothetical protein
VSADVTDDISGVSFIEVRYNSPTDSGFKNSYLSYNASSGKYEGSFEIGEYDDEGTWKLAYIYLLDQQKNHYSYSNTEGSL